MLVKWILLILLFRINKSKYYVSFLASFVRWILTKFQKDNSIEGINFGFSINIKSIGFYDW